MIDLARHRHRQRRWVTLITVAILLMPAGPASSQSPAPGYALGPEDVMEVSVWGYPDLTRVVVVRPDGKVSLPLVGSITATGVSVEQLTRTLAQAYGVYIRNPQVTVIVKEFRKIRVSVLGQVARPGAYALPPGSRVLEAISAAGGITTGAFTKEVQLIGSDRRVTVLQTEALLRAEARHNPVLRGGETVVVPEIRKLTVSVVGQVNRPGSYDLPPGARLLDLLSSAGGVTEAAALRDAQLIRPGEASESVDLEQLLAGDPEVNRLLRGGETLVVREDLTNFVNVLGEVTRPGRYRLKGEMRVLDALLAAGGLTERASVTQARLVRASRESDALHLDSLLLRQEMGRNVPLRAGDTIFIPEETNNKVYVLGDVNHPGVFVMKGEVTVLQAIAMAGGLVQRGVGTAKAAHIVRRNTREETPLMAGAAKVDPLPGGGLLISMDVQALMRGGGPIQPVIIEAGDVVVVPQTSLGGLQVFLNILAGLLGFFK